jgi:hypothetical protein
VEGEPEGERQADRIARGVACSLALHGTLALLIVFGLPSLVQLPPQAAPLLPVDLVQFGQETASPARQAKAELPQAKAPPAAGLQSPGPVPVADTPLPSPQVARPRLKLGTGADRQVALAVPETHKLPATTRQPKHALPAAIAPSNNPPPPTQNLNARLQSLTTQQQLQASTPRNNWQQADAGSSTVDASSANAALGQQATYSIKDFIRAQIERHWYLDKNALEASNFVVSIHVTLNRNGSVADAVIVPDPSYATNALHRNLAFSARDAVLLSSPLLLPPGTYDLVKDMTLKFSPRDVLQ